MSETFEPKIVGFLCNWCSYRAADLAGTARIKYAPNVRIIRVMCSGRVDPDLRPQGPRPGGRRRDDRRLPSGRVPLHRAELQGHAALPDAQAHARGDGRRGRPRPAGLGLGRRRPATGRGDRQVRRRRPQARAAELAGQLGRETGSGQRPWRRSSKEHAEAMEVPAHERQTARRNWRSTGRPPAAAAKSPILAIDEKILDVAAAFDIVFWPCATDGKVRDVEKMADGEIDVCLFNGGIRTSEQEYMAQLHAAQVEGPGGLRLLRQRRLHPRPGQHEQPQGDLRQRLPRDAPSTENPKDVRPQTETEDARGHAAPAGLLRHAEDARPDGRRSTTTCPAARPRPRASGTAITAILDGKLPPPGSVIGANTTVCDECTRKRTEKKIKKFNRTWEIIPDEETCLLEQGLLCCGIATRAGCGALCPQVNSPCIGCYGPNDGVQDFGARLMSALASVIDSDDPDEIDRIIQEGIPDPVGTFYRFSLAQSLLRRKKRKRREQR